MPSVAQLNAMAPGDAEREFMRCCGSGQWARAMAARRPFASPKELMSSADSEFALMQRRDLMEAFGHHPRIGERTGERAAATGTEAWSKGEQAGAASADAEMQRALIEGNRAYEVRFGHVFLVCATGKSAGEMLGALRSRLKNDADSEYREASEQLRLIARVRLEKLLSS